MGGGTAITRSEIISYGLRGDACEFVDSIPEPEEFTARESDWLYKNKGLAASGLREHIDEAVDEMKEKLITFLQLYSHQLRLTSLEKRVGKLEGEREPEPEPKRRKVETEPEEEPVDPVCKTLE